MDKPTALRIPAASCHALDISGVHFASTISIASLRRKILSLLSGQQDGKPLKTSLSRISANHLSQPTSGMSFLHTKVSKNSQLDSNHTELQTGGLQTPPPLLEHKAPRPVDLGEELGWGGGVAIRSKAYSSTQRVAHGAGGLHPREGRSKRFGIPPPTPPSQPTSIPATTPLC